jgi:steroid 5-alpha reductase family enzyme
VGTYLFARVLREGKDSRFDKIKTSPVQFAGAWAAQATWVSLCLLPILAINSVPAAAFAAVGRVRPSDVVGLALFAGGLAFEVTADRQKSRWLAEKKAKVHDEEFMTRGLWSRR